MPDAPAIERLLGGDEVQDLTNKAADAFKRDRKYLSPAVWGTRVHDRVAGEIRGKNDPNFVAEASCWKAWEDDPTITETDCDKDVVPYGALDTVRVDVLERKDATTACVYDIKTGRRGLSNRRMKEIARSVVKNFGLTIQRIIVTEVRPTRSR